MQCYNARGPPPADLRYKQPVDLSLSDRKLWQEMPVGDIWLDAQLPKVWSYLLSNRHLKVPDSWYQAIQAFDKEVMDLEAWCDDQGFGALRIDATCPVGLDLVLERGFKRFGVV